mgnify:CR=1 FL=1|tara:strand:+ start:123 stop:344 length:222 start_codon:yes stop_codon:yes gene_type:complete
MLKAKNADDIKSIEKSRNIVTEIINFGVNDSEIIKIISLLSLELENTELMRKIHFLLNPNEEVNENKKENLII